MNVLKWNDMSNRNVTHVTPFRTGNVPMCKISKFQRIYNLSSNIFTKCIHLYAVRPYKRLYFPTFNYTTKRAPSQYFTKCSSVQTLPQIKEQIFEVIYDHHINVKERISVLFQVLAVSSNTTLTEYMV